MMNRARKQRNEKGVISIAAARRVLLQGMA